MMCTPSTWKVVKLGDIVSFKTGKLDSNAATANGAYPFFTCAQETYRTDTCAFDCECVLLAGNNAAGIYPLKYFKGKFDAYQRTYIIRSNDNGELANRFLYFALRPKLEHLKSISTGAATKFLTLGLLKGLDIEIPPLETQHKIASILSAYDDLIENNTRRIKILEEMAQAIYREWFVNFRFPGHEKVKMVDSSLGEIPEGWEVVTLADIAKINSQSIRKGSAPETINYIDIASVSTGTIDKIENLPFPDSPSRARRIVKHGDIIWSTVRPNRKSYSLIIDPVDDLIASTGFAVISTASVPFTYLYQALTTDDFIGHLVNHATGAAYPAVNAAVFEKAEILKPNKAVIDRFHNIAEDLYLLRNRLTVKNQNLRQTRDMLLPKLISGAVDVSALEIEVKALSA